MSINLRLYAIYTDDGKVRYTGRSTPAGIALKTQECLDAWGSANLVRDVVVFLRDYFKDGVLQSSREIK